MKGQRYIFTTYDYLKQIRFGRLKKICDKIFIVANKEDKIPAKLIQKTHKWGDALKWFVVSKNSESATNNRLSYLLGKEDQRTKSGVEFILLSDDSSLDPIVSSLKAAGRSCLRVGSADSSTKDKEEEQPLLISPIGVEKKKVAPIPVKAFRTSLDGNDTIQSSAKITLERLQNGGHRPENVETLKHYIHLFGSHPNGQRASIDQVLEYLEANKEISIEEGVVKYNF